MTITNSYISAGDDNVAIGGNSNPGASNISVTNNYFGDGHGASIGSYTLAGVSNVLFDHLSFAGNTANTNQNGIRIKSDVSRGGLVENIVYSNICMQNVRHPIVIDPFYTKGVTGNLIPRYRNITLQNVRALTEGLVTLKGYDATSPATITLNNVQLDNIKPSDLTQDNLDLTLGPDPVNFAAMLTGPNIVVNNRVSTSNAPYACPASVFAPVMGELTGATRSNNSRRTGVAVQVQVLATKAVPYQTYLANLKTDLNATLALPAPSGSVTVFEGTTPLGTANVAGGQFVSIALGTLSQGTHTLTATYSGDGNYPGMVFGNYVITMPVHTPRGAVFQLDPPLHRRSSRLHHS